VRQLGRVAALLALVMLAGFAAAQDPAASGPGVGLGPGHLDGRPRDEAHKYLEAYFISNLQERLALTNDQFAKLLPAVMRLQTERRELQQRRMHAAQELRRLLESGKATEASVADALKELKRAESEGPAAVWKQQEAVDAQLTPIQQAKFRILEFEVERRVRDLLAGVRRPGGPARRGGARVPNDR